MNPVTGVLENVDIERPNFNWETYIPYPWKTLWDRDIVAARCILIKGKNAEINLLNIAFQTNGYNLDIF